MSKKKDPPFWVQLLLCLLAGLAFPFILDELGVL